MLAALLITGILTFAVGLFVGIWIIRKIWPTCPECGRGLRCAVHDAQEIRFEQAASGLPQRTA